MQANYWPSTALYIEPIHSFGTKRTEHLYFRGGGIKSVPRLKEPLKTPDKRTALYTPLLKHSEKCHVLSKAFWQNFHKILETRLSFYGFWTLVCFRLKTITIPGKWLSSWSEECKALCKKEIKHIQTSRTSTNNQASNSFQKESKESKNNIQSLIPGDSWMFIPTLWYSIGNFIHPHPTWDYHHFTSWRHAHLLATSSKASRKASLVSCATGSTKKKGITWRRAVEVVNRSNHVFVHQENSWGSPIRKVMKV